jgi:V8-like Glu-specific endopeptidase
VGTRVALVLGMHLTPTPHLRLSRAARRLARRLGGGLLGSALALSLASGCGGPLDRQDSTAPAQAEEVAAAPATVPFSANLSRALDLARRSSSQFVRYADGSHDGDDIARGRIPPPTDGSALTAELLALVSSAGSYSEAILLVRVAGQDPSRPVPPVPAALSNNPSDPDLEFAGRNVPLPYAVQQALEQRRVARDRTVDTLSDRDFDARAAQEAAAHLGRRRDVAAALGWRFDGRDDLHVTVLPTGDIWRRKRASTHVVVPRDGEAGSAPLAAGTPDELRALPAGLRTKILGGSDSRELRSTFNGFDMGSSVWEPKGAIVDDGRTGQEVPVEVDCSATKIGKRRVVTAGHCLFKNGSWNDNTQWIPGADGVAGLMNGADPSPNGLKTSFARIVRGPWFDHEWGNYDFGLFILHDNASSCSLHWHGWRKRSGLLNDTVHLYGYPDETGTCTASPLDDDACHGSIYGNDAAISYAGSYRVHYPIDTQPGQSGSSFYEIDGARYVLGVHQGEYSNSVNQGVRINDGNRDMINDAASDYPALACP